jgi:hypothetical protein
MNKPKEYDRAKAKTQNTTSKYNQRVDIIRSPNLIKNYSNNEVMPKRYHRGKMLENAHNNNIIRGHINRTFISSRNDLRLSDLNLEEENNIPTRELPTVSGLINTKHKQKNASKPSRQDSDVNYLNTTNNKKTCLTKRNTIIIITIIVILMAIMLGILIWLLTKKPIVSSEKCEKVCVNNRYCFKHYDQSSAATCDCKPGYIESFSNKCDQIACYKNYMPYTFLDQFPNDSAINSLPYEYKYIKPFCCPNSAKNFSQSSSCCGVPRSNLAFNRVGQRIIGGQILTDNSVFPWITYVSQIYRSNPKSRSIYIKNCTGSLISDRYVLTAGHCIDIDLNIVDFNSEFNNAESLFRIYFGFVNKVNNINQNTERRVVKIIRHPLFNISTFENDIALLLLDRPVQRDSNVDFICLYNYGHDDSQVKDMKFYAAGWGSIVPLLTSLVYPDYLNYVDLALQPMDECKYILEDPKFQYLFNQNTHVCAGYKAPVGKGNSINN